MAKTLVIDDEEALRTIINEILLNLSMDSILAENGNHAIELAANNNDINLIILDWNMPGMSGEDTYKELHKIYPQCPVIFTSGSDISTELSNMGLDCTHEFLKKPFRITDFSKLITKLTD